VLSRGGGGDESQALAILLIEMRRNKRLPRIMETDAFFRRDATGGAQFLRERFVDRASCARAQAPRGEKKEMSNREKESKIAFWKWKPACAGEGGWGGGRNGNNGWGKKKTWRIARCEAHPAPEAEGGREEEKKKASRGDD